MSGRWYDGEKRFYGEKRARSLVAINYNLIEAVCRKTRRLRKYGHCFLDQYGKYDGAGVKRAIDDNEYRAKMTKEDDDQSNEVASIEMEVTEAMHEEDDRIIALTDIRLDNEQYQFPERTVSRWRSSPKLLNWTARKLQVPHVNLNSKRSLK